MENLGIPYMWSKRNLAKYIVQYIKNENPKAKYFYDIFWGGGAVSFEALRQGFEKVYYLDLDKGMCNLMKQIKNGIPKEWNRRVSREDFLKLKDKTEAKSQFKSQNKDHNPRKKRSWKKLTKSVGHK